MQRLGMRERRRDSWLFPDVSVPNLIDMFSAAPTLEEELLGEIFGFIGYSCQTGFQKVLPTNCQFPHTFNKGDQFF